MKSKATRSRRLSRMPNNRKLRDWFLRDKYNRHYKKELKIGVPKRVRKRKRMTFKEYFSYLESLPSQKTYFGILPEGEKA